MPDQITNVKREPFHSRIAFRLTNKCNLGCSHCMAKSTGSSDDAFDIKFLCNIIAQAARIETVDLVGLTGGEPFLFPLLLREAASVARSLRIKTSVISSGYWAKDLSSARKILREMELNYLTLSVDRHHQSVVPISSIENAIRAANDFGIKCKIRVTYSSKDEILAVTDELASVKNMFDLQYQPLIRFGRAKNLPSEDFPISPMSCETACATADVPLITSSGDVFACCGPCVDWGMNQPLYLGNLHKTELAKILATANENYFIQAIRTIGPHWLRRLASDSDDIALGNRACLDICDLCSELATNNALKELIVSRLSDSDTRRRIDTYRLFRLGEV